MPSFSRSDALGLSRLLALPGRKVHVSFTAGNDSTGDGSVSAPYLTIARGNLDLRNGRNDVLVLIDGGVSAEAPVLISGKSNIAVIGLGLPEIRPPSGRRAISAVSAWSLVSGRARATIASGHGLLVGEYVFVHGAASTGTARPRGLGRVSISEATTVDLDMVTVVTGQQPITGGAQGWLTPVPLVIEGGSGVYVSGLRFSPPLLTDAWSGLGISAGLTLGGRGQQILLTDCLFQAAALGIGGFPSERNFTGDGVGLAIERNLFVLATAGATFTPLARNFGALYVTNAAQVDVVENLFQRTDVLGEAMLADAAIHVGDDAKFSTAFVGNRFDGSVVAGEGIPLDRIFRIQPTRTPDRLFVEGNYYSHSSLPGGGESFSVGTAGMVRERFAVRFPSQDRIPSPIDTIRRGAGALATLRVTGGTATVVQTTATQADGWFAGSRVVVYGSGGAAFALVHSYAAASGTFTLERPLPFTPAAGDTFLVLATGDVHSLLDHTLSGHGTPGTVGGALTNADVATSTRAAPGAAMDLVTDALDADAVAASGAAEIAAAVPAAPSAGAVADAVLDEVVDGHLGAGSLGEALSLSRAAAAGRVRLSTVNPAQWVLEVYAEDGSTVLRTLDLLDQSGDPITSTNNPLSDPSVLFADRQPV